MRDCNSKTSTPRPKKLLFGLFKDKKNLPASEAAYGPVISVMLVGAKYLRVGNCLFLCVHGWGREHEVEKKLQIPGGYLAAEIDPYIK